MRRPIRHGISMGLALYGSMLVGQSTEPNPPAQVSSEVLVPAKNSEGRWGYQDESGHYRIPPQFDKAMSFSEGLAAVTLHEKVGYVDINGRMVISPQFVDGEAFHEGMALVYTTWGMNVFGRIEGWDLFRRAGYIDQTGKFVIGPRYVENAACFSEGVAAFRQGVGSPGRAKWGYLDKSGKWAIKPEFDVAGDFSEGLAAVAIYPKNGTTTPENWGPWGYIDHTGEFVIAPQFRSAHSFKNGIASVFVWNKGALRRSERRECIDKRGSIVTCPPPERRPTKPVGSRPLRNVHLRNFVRILRPLS